MLSDLAGELFPSVDLFRWSRNLVEASRVFLLLLTLFFVQAADVSILASWYRELGNQNSPVIIIIDDMERCSRSVLSDFILMLRYCSAVCNDRC